MKTFIDIFIEQFNNCKNNFYIGRVVTEQLIIINKIDDVISKDDIKHYLKFLNELPQESYLEISTKIWEYLFNIIVEGNDKFYNNKQISKNINKIPSKKINEDLKIINKFEEVANRVFTSYCTRNTGLNIMSLSLDKKINRFSMLEYDKDRDIKKSKIYSIREFFEILDLIQNDLESKEFKFISKNSYYKKPNTPLKENLKEYLISTCKKHNINYSDGLRNLFESLIKHI